MPKLNKFTCRFFLLTHRIFFFALIALSLTLLAQDYAAAVETTDITGTITARRQGAVKVEFKAHPKAAPKVGDKVDFKTKIKGFEAKAGKGEVTQIESSHVWVKVLEKKPKLKMTGIIHATGAPGPAEYAFNLDRFENNGIIEPAATLRIDLPAGLEFERSGSYGQHYRNRHELKGVHVWLKANPFKRHKQLSVPHKEKTSREGAVYGDNIKIVWKDRKLNGSFNCLTDHVIGPGPFGLERSMWATCVDSKAHSSSQDKVQVYELRFIIQKSLAKENWDLPWEEWFLKAVKSFSNETK